MSGNINLIWRADKDGPNPKIPQHRYGEGDLKTRAWAHHLIHEWKLAKVLILSTDLDNIPIFARPEFTGVDLMANGVYRNERGQVAPKPRVSRASLQLDAVNINAPIS
tara:strand:- start:1766 stop:2089 length:324 start_codon:yes stop_codon:yes gene_type:complete